MILRLSLDLVQVVCRSTLLSRETLSAPLEAAVQDESVVLEVPAGPAQKLVALGAVPGEPAPGRRFLCWPELLGSQPAPEPELPLGTLLFVTQPSRLVALSAELLRLGCDQQSLAVLGEVGLLRATNPAYFTVLRHVQQPDSVHVFEACGAGIFSRVGWRATEPERLAAPAQSLLLIDAPNIPWRTLPDGPWHDLGRQLDVITPITQTLAPSREPPRLTVSLRLASAPKTPPSLWIVTHTAVAQVQDLVETVPQRVVQSLLFAVTEGDSPTVILRARTGAETVLSLDALALSPHDRVPNLFLPVGRAIDPPLRAEWLTAQLAPDPDHLVCLDDLTGLRTRRIPQTAFRPLSDWVEYRCDQSAEPLKTWMASTLFEMSAFVSIGCEWTERPQPVANTPQAPSPRPMRAAPRPKPEPKPQPRSSASFSVPQPHEATDAEREISALETEIFRSQRPIEDPARAHDWLKLGGLYAAVGRGDQAHLCWIRALWLHPTLDTASAVAFVEAQPGQPSLEQCLQAPTRPHVRAAVAYALAGRYSAEAHPQLSHYLQQHASHIDLRSIWLATHKLAEHSDDQLARLRAKDRIFDSLRGGLSVARNVPAFVRAHGTTDHSRLVDVLGELLALAMATPRKMSSIEAPPQHTEAYVRLAFASCFARLGAPDRADAEAQTARTLVDLQDPVHGWAVAAFTARLEHAKAGLSSRAPLPAKLLAEREALSRFERYKIDRLRQASQLLDPSGALDPFAAWQAGDGSAHGAHFDGLTQLDPPLLTTALQSLLKAPEHRASAKSLTGVLDHLALLPSRQAGQMLETVIHHIHTVEPEGQFQVIQGAADLAAGLERTDLLSQVITVTQSIARARLKTAPQQVATALGQLTPIVRAAGLGTTITELLLDLEGSLKGTDLETHRARLQVAAAYAQLDDLKPFPQAFEATVSRLDTLRPAAQLTVVRELALAASHSSATLAIASVRTLMRRYVDVTDTFNTNSHFCISVISFMESLALALTGETLGLSPEVRAWIAQDEHSLRQRIHRDLRTTAGSPNG